ncbi:MAG TPA: hypothetical protein VGG53_04605 [Mycobacterium sp.]|jgi:hypothetical protein|uniref:hypothetical protein n=1 Tax=Mycobacterium sp. TaxID=1785 RepID=UPI002F42CB40
MSGPNDTTRPISVAELLAKNGTIGAPAPARRRRRRGNSDAVTVAELTGEIPIITDDMEPEPAEQQGSASRVHRAHSIAPVDDGVAETPAEDNGESSSYWSEPEPRWPASAPPRPREAVSEQRESRLQRSAYPRPVRNNERDDQSADRSGAEGMKPDPIEDYAGMSVDVMDTDVRDAEPVVEDSAYVRSYLQSSAGKGDVEQRTNAGYPDIADVAEEDHPEDRDDRGEPHTWSRSESMRFGGMVVLQSFLAVGFGAGLFIAFDQLWRWNNIVALVLSVLVILGLVVGVRVVRKTEDIGSTLIAVAVGALVTLGPLALLQSG